MKRILFIALISIFTNLSIGQTPGSLDTSFNSTGMVILQPGTLHENLYGLAVQPDSAIVFCGVARISAPSGFTFDMLVGRLNPSGSLDQTFGNNGYFSLGSSGGSVFGYDIKLQPDGKILVCGGYSVTAADPAFIALRLNTNGTLDTTFGAGTGYTLVQVGLSEDYAYESYIRPDGKIILAGASKVPGFTYNRGALVQLLSDGTVDTTFGNQGITLFQLGANTSETFRCMEVTPGGKIITAGYSYQSNTEYFVMAGFSPDGIIDSTFATDGHYFGSTISYAFDLELDNNNLFAGGRLSTSQGYDVGIMCFDTMGVINTTWALNGYLSADYNPIDACYALQIQTDGKLLVAGTSGQGGPFGDRDFFASRYTAAGTIDAGFGNGGYVTYSVGSAFDDANAIALQSDGKILLGGFAALTNNDMVIMRLHNDYNPTGLSSIDSHSEWKLYPNPVTGSELNIYGINNDEAFISIEIVSLNGQLIKNISLSDISSADKNIVIKIPGSLANGMYIVRLNTTKSVASLPFIYNQ